MNVTSMTFKNGFPETVTAELTIQEMAFLAKVTGRLSHTTAKEIYPGAEDVYSDIYDETIGMVFNRYWDAGVDGFLRGDEE